MLQRMAERLFSQFLRHLDPRAPQGDAGYVIGLSPKGHKAKKDTSGFVVS